MASKSGIDTLYGLLNAIAARVTTLRTATVTAVTGSTCTINLGGGTLTGVPHLASYTPTAGDVALLLQKPGQLLIIGKAA